MRENQRQQRFGIALCRTRGETRRPRHLRRSVADAKGQIRQKCLQAASSLCPGFRRQDDARPGFRRQNRVQEKRRDKWRGDNTHPRNPPTQTVSKTV